MEKESSGSIEEILAARKERNAPTDEAQEQPEEILEDESIEEEEESVELAEDSEDEAEAEIDVSDSFLLDGEEISAETVKEWKAGHMKDADYRQKTAKVAEDRKALEQKLSDNAKAAEDLEVIVGELESELLKDSSSDDLNELRDYDPSAYLKKKEEIDAKKALIASAKSKAKKLRDDAVDAKVSAEQKKLFALNSEWMDGGKTTEAFESDVKMMNAYLENEGWSSEDVASISTAKQWMVIKAAAKASKSKEKNSALAKKVRKAPKAAKPSAKGSAGSALERKLAEAEQKASKTGKVKDIHEARKLRKQINR